MGSAVLLFPSLTQSSWENPVFFQHCNHKSHEKAPWPSHCFWFVRQYVISKILRFYAIQQADLVFARKVYEQIEAPTTYLFNIILRGLAQTDKAEYALAIYINAQEKGMEPDNLTFPFAVKVLCKD
jgi:pentatricopeptide repeat protein